MTGKQSVNKANLVSVYRVLEVLVEVHRVGTVVEQGLEDGEVGSKYGLVENTVQVLLICLGLRT